MKLPVTTSTLAEPSPPSFQTQQAAPEHTQKSSSRRGLNNSLSPGEIVVIAYGDPSRGDNAVGHRIAERIGHWGLPEVRVIAVPRLAAELTEAVSRSHLALFVHGVPSSRGQEVTARALEPCPSKITSSRIEDPCSLLSITQATYGRYPYAWCIEVPGVNFDFGQSLSPEAEHGIGVALARINHLIEESCYLPV